mmetsp:Transcript_49411/g.92414  ORF Transcript_49411/g.92414 Transcript_49411/m.92414 type:complete len:85 (-) Transcript_49411:790-1044(-)
MGLSCRIAGGKAAPWHHEPAGNPCLGDSDAHTKAPVAQWSHFAPSEGTVETNNPERVRGANRDKYVHTHSSPNHVGLRWGTTGF